MKISLIQPGLDKAHQTQRQAYECAEQTPETGLAVLSAWLGAYSKTKPHVEVLDPSIGIERAASVAADSDMLGISDWYSNHANCMELARIVKEKTPKTKVVIGGPNASMMPQLVLQNHPYVDFVVYRDGEDALLGLADGMPLRQIPNLWFRNKSGNIEFTFRRVTDLSKMPLWDFENFQNIEKRLSTYKKLQNRPDHWLVPPIAVFSLRGCVKALQEGPCYYCTSAQTMFSILPAEKFWAQIKHLHEKYNANLFYVGDDIFAINTGRISELRKAKPPGIKPMLRAYGYLPILSALGDNQLAKTAKDLGEIGIFNLFFGSENYDAAVLRHVNKRGISIERTLRVMGALYAQGGVKTTMAFMVGLPGETKTSVRTNLQTLERITKEESFERLYISIAMPLVGTPWFRQLSASKEVRRRYLDATGRDLENDDSPDYVALTKIAIEHSTSVSPEAVNNCVREMIDTAKKSIPEHRIGGFFLEGC